jgi:hypothetical protein
MTSCGLAIFPNQPPHAFLLMDTLKQVSQRYRDGRIGSNIFTEVICLSQETPYIEGGLGGRPILNDCHLGRIWFHAVLRHNVSQKFELFVKKFHFGNCTRSLCRLRMYETSLGCSRCSSSVFEKIRMSSR